MEWLNKILQWLKIPLKILLPGITIFSGIIMFSDDKLLEKLYLLEFRGKNGFIFGILFTICISLIIVYILWYLFKIIIKKYEVFKCERNYYKMFTNLADVYKRTLIVMYKSPTHSIKMDLNNSVASYLERIHAIGRSEFSVRSTVFDYYLQPWVEQCIIKLCDEIEVNIRKYKNKVRKLSNQTEIDKVNDDIKELEKLLNYVRTPDEIEKSEY